VADDKPSATPDGEPFLSRWSRLKREAATAAPPPVEVSAEAAAEPPPLPPIESLTPDSDFSVFMEPRVPPELRQAALKKLFTDPHFNLMDGLDIYIEDYGKPDPIPASLVQQLAQFRNLRGIQREEQSKDEEAHGATADLECADATITSGECLPSDADTTSLESRDGTSERDTMSREEGQLVNSVAGRAEG
jgi:hypothetical protein